MVLDGILALPVTSMPARIVDVSAIGTSVSWLAVTPFVLTVTLLRLTTTSCDIVASYPSTNVNKLRVELALPILILVASLPICKLVTFAL